MVKDNIVIKIGDKIVDYDSDTAIALTYRAFDFSNIDEFFINGTNNFSLPITGRNRQIFEFSDMTNSNPNMPYDKEISEIYVNGVLAMRGTIYLESIDDRYNCIFTEDKSVFNALKELRINSPRVGTSIAPTSLSSMLVSYWNSTVKNSIQSTYNPSTSSEWLSGVYKYCIERGALNSRGEYAPANDFCIPWVMNCFGQDIPYAPIANNEIETRKNNMFNTITEYVYGYGLNLGRSIVTVDSNGNYVRNGQYDVSPMWASIDIIISMLEEYTGYTFENIVNIINGYTGTGNRLFFHLAGVELELNTTPSTGGQYSFSYNGRLRVINIGENRDYHFQGTETSDIEEDGILKQSCLDLIKMLMQEFNLVMDINPGDKKITFHKFDDIRTSDRVNLKLVSLNSKEFSIDGINQKQSIGYEGDNTTSNIKIDCFNNNISEGSYDNKLFTINRYIYSNNEYGLAKFGSKTIKLYAADFADRGTQTGIVMAIPTSSNVASYEAKQVSIAGLIFQEDGDNATSAIYADYITQSGYNEQFQTLRQPNVSTYNQYSYIQKIVEKPQTLDVDVVKDELFLNTFSRVNSISIEGLTGKYYVQEIGQFNPRIDNSLNVKLIKLPMDVLKWPSFAWRTATYDEMNYIINTRPNASSLKGLGRVNVNGTYVNGCFIMPDDFVAPESVTFTPTTANYTTNSYTLEQFTKMENVGVVFIPANGHRDGVNISYPQSRSFTYLSNCYLHIEPQWNLFVVQTNYNANRAMNVRLIRSSQQGKFSTPTGNIDFAPANLQYHCTKHIWRFAENQYDYIGQANANISDSYNGWIDLFGYGTSGVNYSPTLHTTNYADYASGNISGTMNDWGVNEIEYGYDE